ncbi:hypothetical protein CR513_35364, partial [Mucuna pruriens]
MDGASSFALLSFMDAYSGYNQIRMYPQDEAKIAFITDSGTFCYKVMSFGLKNAGETYQRLMDKIFKKIIGINVEVYMDDTVVKSIVGLGKSLPSIEEALTQAEPGEMLLRHPGQKFPGIHANREGDRG